MKIKKNQIFENTIYDCLFQKELKCIEMRLKYLKATENVLQKRYIRHVATSVCPIYWMWPKKVWPRSRFANLIESDEKYLQIWLEVMRNTTNHQREGLADKILAAQIVMKKFKWNCVIAFCCHLGAKIVILKKYQKQVVSVYPYFCAQIFISKITTTNCVIALSLSLQSLLTILTLSPI